VTTGSIVVDGFVWSEFWERSIKAHVKVVTNPAMGLGRVLAILSAATAFAKKVKNKLSLQKKEWRRENQRCSLASAIRAPWGWLPTCDMAPSTEEACEADLLPPLPWRPRFLIVGAAGNPFYNPSLFP
jgi:hypothetical protein